MLEQAKQLLQSYFGYSSFRKGQEEIILNVLNGEDTLGIMPTGGGKSICYQIPALMANGVTIVISPLISLMKDQVDALLQTGISATYINSSLSHQEIENRLEEAANGEFKLIYIAPERLDSSSFRRLLYKLDVSILAIDEAHCISQWGHDFRPSYRSIQYMIQELPVRPVVIALTATATKEVTSDISQLLSIDEQDVFITGFKRENLLFSVIKGENKREFVTRYLKENQNQAGIIYAATRREVNDLHNFLVKSGYRAGKYHAGLSEEERNDNQEKFLYDDLTIMVATNAFGMGINKSNVRYVLHFNLPKNIEAYYQEAGRAGRDGEPSECHILYGAQDIQLQKFLIEQTGLEFEKKQNEYIKLQQMIDYCHTEKCLQLYILEYFGEEHETRGCGRCLHCRDNREQIEITTDALKIFSCIKRMNEKFGKTLVAQVLKGSNNKKVKQFRFNELSTYGLMKEYTEKDIVSLIDFLVAEGYVSLSNSQFPILTLNEKALFVIKGQEKVYKKEKLKTNTIIEDNGLFELLRDVRKKIASRDSIPPYLVFSDSTLREMSQKCPRNEKEMFAVKGVAQVKFERFGQDFLQVIQEYIGENDESETKIIDVQIDEGEPRVINDDGKPSHIVSYDLFQAGMGIDTISKKRNMKPMTIQDHLIRAISEGQEIDWERIVPNKFEALIFSKIEELGAEKLKPLKEALPDEIDYFAIKGAICKRSLMSFM
ncbi:DNA helicase RecQ [Bacillus luteolus]|uniref:DNA helicase RecQ n=1 Tax=Litchfieldia luteola TaxID=682179 RepID=A0ABR9QKI2_9BACI|nr:DNA helicase RecQ [Cytobacillus luteolus]MBE4909005.1 DNA helicase RecQ [Cytobacillus luteolus]MBP1941864.1 ATP-dependent DNA helicase RecQ [Cytobacillus luteolus]